MHWLGLLIAGLSTQRPGLDARSVHVRFMVDKVALWKVYSEYFRFSLSISFHQFSIRFFFKFLLLEGRKGEAWKTSSKQSYFGNGAAVNKRVLRILSFKSLMVKQRESSRIVIKCAAGGVRHPQHTQTGSNSSTIATGSSNGVTNTRCCRYSCMRSWWWVEVTPETCRAVSRYK